LGAIATSDLRLDAACLVVRLEQAHPLLQQAGLNKQLFRNVRDLRHELLRGIVSADLRHPAIQAEGPARRTDVKHSDLCILINGPVFLFCIVESVDGVFVLDQQLIH
jgi:hypothetical protein